MIRRSLLVAVVAAVLSLLVHILGLNVASNDLSLGGEGSTAPQEQTSSAFTDFAEPAPEAPPPEVTEPDPVEPVPPTSQAMIASETPQNVVTPDTGTAQEASPDPPEAEEAPPPEAAEPAQAEASPPAATPDPVPDAAPEGTPDGAEAAVVEAAPPVVPDALAPDVPELTIASVPDAVAIPPEPEEELDDTPPLDTAVTTSLRPPRERPTEEELAALGEPDSAGEQGFTVGEEGADSGSATGVIQGSSLDLLSREPILTLNRASGNASTTNYAGKVLAQLNRPPRANTLGVKGQTHVQFEIAPNGSVAWVRILLTSGSVVVDREATARVRSRGPYPRPPGGEARRLSFVFRSE